MPAYRSRITQMINWARDEPSRIAEGSSYLMAVGSALLAIPYHESGAPLIFGGTSLFLIGTGFKYQRARRRQHNTNGIG